MRTLTEAQQKILKMPHRQNRIRVKVKNADGVWKDLTDIEARDFLTGYEFGTDIDQPTTDARIDLAGYIHGFYLSPLVQASKINKNAAGKFSPLIDMNREIKIEVATVPEYYEPVEDDYRNIFEGKIVKPMGSDDGRELALDCIDKGYDLFTAFIYTKDEYGDDDGTVMAEDVIQALLEKWRPGTTLFVPAPSGWAIKKYQQQQEQLMSAIQVITQQRGWDFRYKWRESAGQWQATFYEPPRTKSIPDWTFGPDEYYVIPSFTMNHSTIRTFIRVSYHENPEDPPSYVSYPEIGPTTAGTSTSLTDGTKEWTPDEFAGLHIWITSGTGKGQYRTISSNTATTINVSSPWDIIPDTTSRYAIVHPNDSTPYQGDVNSFPVVRHGELFMQIAEEATSQINTKAEALTLARSIYLDVSRPSVEYQIEVDLFWPVEIGDLYFFKANKAIFDTDQLLAVVGFRHRGNNKGLDKTILQVRGKPAGKYRGWFAIEAIPGVAPDTGAPSTPTGLSLTTGTEAVEQDTKSFILASWNRNIEDNLAYYILRYRRVNGDWTYMEIPISSTPKQKITPVIGNVEYEVEVKAVNSRNRASAWTIATIKSAKDTSPPAVPTGLSVIPAIRGITVIHAANSEPDLAGYEIYVSDINGFTPGAETLKDKGNKIRWDFTDLIPGTTYYVKIRAYDTSGNFSGFTDQVSAVAGQVDTLDIVKGALSQRMMSNYKAGSKFTASTQWEDITYAQIDFNLDYPSSVLVTFSANVFANIYDQTVGGTYRLVVDGEGIYAAERTIYFNIPVNDPWGWLFGQSLNITCALYFPPGAHIIKAQMRIGLGSPSNPNTKIGIGARELSAIILKR